LSNANFTAADLSDACLDEAYANGVKLVAATLIRTSLVKATLVRASLRDSDTSSANFSHAKLNRAYLVSCNLTYATINHADLSGAYMLSSCLNYVDLRQSSLIRTYLGCAAMQGVDLQGADLSGANLWGVDIAAIADATDASFASNQGLTREAEQFVQDLGATLIPTQPDDSLSEKSRVFETKQRLDEAKIDIMYRYFDLEASLGTMAAAIERVDSSLLEAQELKIISSRQVEYLEKFLVTQKQDLERLTAEMEDRRQAQENDFVQMQAEDIRQWLDEDFKRLLEMLHEDVLQLNQRISLIMVVWRSLASLHQGIWD